MTELLQSRWFREQFGNFQMWKDLRFFATGLASLAIVTFLELKLVALCFVTLAVLGVFFWFVVLLG